MGKTKAGLGVIIILMLAVLVTGCGYEAKTELTPATANNQTLPASVKEAWVGWQQNVGGASEIAEWMTNLIGSKYKNRTITKIIREKFIRSDSGSVTEVFVLVGLGD